MKVCVFGLWHLGVVTSACLATNGFEVVGLDPSDSVVKALKEGKSPVFEPKLDELVKEGIKNGKLSFTTNLREAVNDADITWVTFDTPVDDHDRADTAFVINQVKGLFDHIREDSAMIISSQVPVGTTATLEEDFKKQRPHAKVSFYYSPENLVLGKAIQAFCRPERIVIGEKSGNAREPVQSMLKLFCENILWMSRESAEMTKHALNAYLATSVSFANEIAVLCEAAGADASQVEQGLKSDIRIGQKAYLRPGGAFSGGTLGRDIVFLGELAQKKGVAANLLKAVWTSNQEHQQWAQRKLKECLNLPGKKVAILGLTYKPGTDTLRRSTAVELSTWLATQGANVSAYDPAVKNIPTDMAAYFTLAQSPQEALQDAHALVVATEWNDFKELNAEHLVNWMASPLVLDANRFLQTLSSDARIKYVTVGKPL